MINDKNPWGHMGTFLVDLEVAVLSIVKGGGGLFDQKSHNFGQFFQKFWKKFFCLKHSDFDGKLSGESIFFGPMVVKNFVFSEYGLFHKAGKMRHF